MPELPPDAIQFLRSHESYDQDSPDSLDISDPTVQALLRNATSLETIQREQASLERAKTAHAARVAYDRARSRCSPLTIGASGVDPRTGFDARYDPTHRILWLPISVYPTAIPPSNPHKRINSFTSRPILIAGETRLSHSTAIIPFLDAQGRTHDLTVTGFARLELSSLTPAETISLLENRLGPVTALDADDDAFHPAFIPSHQPPSPPSRTDSSPLSPHTPTGDSTRPTA